MKKYLSLFLVLLMMISLFSCAEKQPDPVTPPADVKTLNSNVQYIRTDGYLDGARYPMVKIIRSKDQLDEYCNANKNLYQFETSETDTFIDACKRYDDTYFQQQILVLVLLEESSGSNRHKVQRVSLENDKELTVEMERIVPEVGTCDMAEWHIIIELEAGIDLTSEEDITVILDGKNITEVLIPVEYSKGYVNFALNIPEGWEYEIDDQEGADHFGINFWPGGQDEGKIRVCYYINGFGVCGTGLSSKGITLGSYSAEQGFYSDSNVWSFIVLEDAPGDYVIHNDGNASFWKEHGEKVMEILASIRVGEGCLPKERAIGVAKKKCIIEYDTVGAVYDYMTGVWTVGFTKREPYARQEITVDPDGKVGDLISITQQ